MTSAADHRQTAPPTGVRRLLLALEVFIALNAIGGSIYGLFGAEDLPPEWLAGTPFESYVIPSLILLAAVGGGMTVAAGSLLIGQRRAAEVSIAA